jgi:hypothetical protein
MKKQNKPDQDNKQLSRRRFLSGVASAAPAAAVVAMAPGAATAEPAVDAHDQGDAKGYRLTSHILAYYKSAAR